MNAPDWVRRIWKGRKIVIVKLLLKKYLPKAAVQPGVVLSNRVYWNTSFDCPTHPLLTPNTSALDSDLTLTKDNFATNIALTSSSVILAVIDFLPLKFFARIATDRPFAFGAAPFNCRFIEVCSGWEGWDRPTDHWDYDDVHEKNNNSYTEYNDYAYV